MEISSGNRFKVHTANGAMARGDAGYVVQQHADGVVVAMMNDGRIEFCKTNALRQSAFIDTAQNKTVLQANGDFTALYEAFERGELNFGARAGVGYAAAN